MKILVTGTYSSGKTEFCRKLKSACEQRGWRTLCPIEIARTVELPLNIEQDGEVSSLLIGMQVERERVLQSNCEILICDRGIPDIWSHNLASAHAGGAVKNRGIECFSQKWADSYDIVIQSIVNNDIDIPRDDMRVEDKEYRKKLECYHRKAMKSLSIFHDFCFSDSELVVTQVIEKVISQVAAKTDGKIS